MLRLFAAPQMLPPTEEPLLAWRQRAVLQLMRLMLLIAIPLIVIDLLLNIQLGRWPLTLFDLGASALVISLSLARQLEYWVRGSAIIGLFLVGFVVVLLNFGLYGIAPLLLIASILLAVLIFGPRATIAVGVICGVVLAGIFIGFAAGGIPYPYEPALHAAEGSWLLESWLLLMGLASLLALMVGSLVSTLHSSFLIARAARADLERMNASLEATVAQRTAELQHTAALLAATQRVARVGGVAFGADQQSLAWTAELYAIHEVPPDTPLDLTLLEQLYPGDSWQTLLQATQQLRAEGTPYELELPAATLAGRPIWVRVRGMADLDADEHHYIGTVQDITTQKEAELALAAQLRYAEALAHCSQALLVADGATDDWAATIQQAMAALRAVVGCRRLSLNLYQSPDEILESPSIVIADQAPDASPYQHMPFKLTEVLPAVVESIGAGRWAAGTPEELFVRGTAVYARCAINGIQSLLIAGFHVAGLWRGFLVASDESPEREWSESTTGLLRTGLDMMAAFFHQRETTTTLRTREGLLHTAQVRQTALLRAIPDLLLGVDGTGRVRFAHLPTQAPLALPSSIIDRQIDQVLPAHLAVGIMALLARREGDLPVITLTITPPDALEERTVESRAVPIDQDEVLLIVRDISDQRRAQADLEHARDAAEAATRAKSAFLATMSHEIRTPLNAVIGMAALLNTTTLTSEQRIFVNTIITGGQALLGVISDILDFSRIESERLELEAAPFDLHACLASAIELVAHAARQKGLAIRYTRAPDVPQAVVGDEGRLRQVLLNLLGNAVKFTDQGAVILDVASAAQGVGSSQLTISVRDTGIGIAAAPLAHIFEPFVQADSTVARRHGGTGLGLAISRQLVALMGGMIDAVSTPGAGSTFTIRIAFTHAPLAALPRPVEPTTTSARSLRVLVAEDNPINQEVITRMLAWLGHEVTVVADGQRALQAVAQAPYDVVLMDVQMPELDGEAATQHIRSLGSAITQPWIVALTANALGGDRERYLRAGMDDYLSKPVQPADLQRALARVPGTDVLGAPNTLAPRPPDTAPLIQWRVIDQLIGSRHVDRAETMALLRRLVDSDLPSQISALEAAAAAQDAAQLRSAAHHLRSGCLQLGAQALAALCAQIEYADAQPVPAELVAQIRTCYEQTRALIFQRYPQER